VDESSEATPEANDPAVADPAEPARSTGRATRRPRQNSNGAAAPPGSEPPNGPVSPSLRHVEDEPLVAEEPPPGDDETGGVDDPEYEEERARAFLAGGAFATVAIDRYDDLASIFGKIDAAPSPRVALVAARGNRELQRALSMRRLQRHLDLSGKDLILVTRSRALRLRAREEDLPAAGSLRRVNFQTYGRGGLRLGWLTLRLPSLGALLAVLLLVGALVAGVVVVFWYLPEADVTVYLPVTAYEDTIELTLEGQSTGVNLQTGSVPARRREVVVTRSFYRPATGTTQVPQDRAAVALRFTSRVGQPVTVPKGTVAVANNGVKFTIANDVPLPRQGTTGDVVALAHSPGTAGNVPPNTVVSIEGEIAQQVTVTNPRPGEKGTDRPQQVVSQADVDGVREFAPAVLTDAAIQELRARLEKSGTVIPPGATAEITDIQSTPPVNEAGRFADVRVTARVSVYTVDNDDLRQVYANHFLPMLGPEEMLLDGEMMTTVIGNGESDRTNDRLPVTVQAHMLVAPFLDRKALQQALAGKTKHDAERFVRNIVGSPEPPVIKVSPGWAPRLPRKAERINVTYAPAR